VFVRPSHQIGVRSTHTTRMPRGSVMIVGELQPKHSLPLCASDGSYAANAIVGSLAPTGSPLGEGGEASAR
jgi:hypothetical protein